jgi:transcriptional regulator with XRE-family HTH domain
VGGCYNPAIGRQATAEFGEWLRRHRLEAHLTQQALAMRSGLTVQAISLLERGARRWPRRDTVGRLSRALRLGPEEAEAFAAASARGRVDALASFEDVAAPAAMRTLPRDVATFTGRAAELDPRPATIRGLSPAWRRRSACTATWATGPGWRPPSPGSAWPAT